MTAAAEKIAPVKAGDSDLLDLSVNVQIDAQGRETITRHEIWRVNSEVGVKSLSSIREPWLAWRQKRPELKVRVIVGGQAHLLDEAVLSDAGLPGAQDVFTDVRFIQGPLPAVAPGAIIEAEYLESDKESVMPGERFDRFRVSHSSPVHHFELTIESAQPVHAVSRGFGWNDEISVKRTDASNAGRQTVRLEVWNLPKFTPEILLPPDAPSGPEIDFSTASSWQSVAAWYAGVIEPFIASAANPEPPRTYEDIVATAGSVLAAIQSRVRYTGVEFGLNAYVPAKPDTVLGRGFGDCKEKATLLAHELRSHGIPAHLALLSPYPFEDALPDLPGLEDFDHVIVYIPGDHPLWIDATDQYAPVTRIPVGDQGRLALIIDPSTTSLIRTPVAPVGESRSIEEITVSLQMHGKAKISGSDTEQGNSEDSLRSLAAAVDRSPDTKKIVDESLKRTLRSDKLTAFDTSSPTDFAKAFVIRFQAENSTFGETRGSVATAEVPAGLTLLGAMTQLSQVLTDAGEANGTEPKTKRKWDYYIASAGSHSQIYTIVPPAGFRPRNVPQLRPVNLGIITVERTVAVKPDNSIVITANSALSKNRFTVAEVQQFAKSYRLLEENPSVRFEFVDSAKDLITGGKDREALQLARKRTEDAPDSATAWSGLAAVLSSLGANSEAIAVARKATTLSPKSAQAFSQLADAYSRDSFGRQFRPGMQLDKAIEAARTACKLEPKDTALAITLAELLEYDNRGIRYSKRARVADAVATLRNVEDELDKSRQANVLAAALFYQGDFAAVKGFYEKDHAGLPEAIRIAALAASQGADDAIAAIEHSSTAESHETVLQNAATLLTVTANYQAAAALLREQARQKGEGDAEVSAQLDLLAQTRARESARLSENPPVALVQRLMYALGDDPDENSARALFVPLWRDLKLTVSRNQMFSLIPSYRTVGGHTLTFPAWLDVAVSNAVFTAEGSDALGYRVRIADPSANGAQKTIAWIVRRGSEYQVLGMGQDLAPPALEALELTRKGDGKDARQWLDWLREDERAPAGSDPLAGIAFLKLWPVENASPEQIAVAAASLAARGKHFESAVEVLQHALLSETSLARRNAIDLALVQGALVNLKPQDALERARSLFASFPNSDEGFYYLVRSLDGAGKSGEALTVINARLANDPDSAVALRQLSSVLANQRKYADAIAALRKLAGNPKVTANDWNQLAWTSLFAQPTLEPDLDAAEKAVRLTQNRSLGYVHTLACVHARTGDTAAARKELVRYLDSLVYSDPDAAARLLHGLILEQIGIPDAARTEYEALKPQEYRESLSSYELGRLRLAAMQR